MGKTISLSDSIYNIVNKHIEVIEVMEILGFEGMTNKKTLSTVGRIMTLAKGAKFKNVDINIVKYEFERYGFVVKE